MAIAQMPALQKYSTVPTPRR